MVTTGALLHGDLPRHLDFNPEEQPLALQVGGSEPADLAQAATPGAAVGLPRNSTSTAAAPASGCSAVPSVPA